MVELNAIFARGPNGEFSLSDGSLPWKNIPELLEDSKKDMEHFKNTTLGHIVVMGFNTYRTFQKPLPGRINVVIDRNCSNICEIDPNSFNFFNSLEAALDFFSDKKFSKQKLFLIGGAKLLAYAFDHGLVNGTVYETVFDHDFPEAETFVKPLSNEWKITSIRNNGEYSRILIHVITDESCPA